MNNKEVLSASCLLLSIVKADGIINNNEINITKDIISDFFNIDTEQTNSIIKLALDKLNNSTDIFEFSKEVNNNFTYQDKIDFICSSFEIAVSDGNLDNHEDYIIKKIATMLNVKHTDLIKAKSSIKKYLY